LLCGKRFREGICRVCLDLFFIITVAPSALRLRAHRGRCIGNLFRRNVGDDVVQGGETIVLIAALYLVADDVPGRDQLLEMFLQLLTADTKLALKLVMSNVPIGRKREQIGE
jgi:hypothetical protein